ncbi:hypothetical protein B0H19DRAFT_965708, partial [Mycena capillaripes]
GGDLYLKQVKVVAQFPSGSTSLIMLAVMDHGNASIQKGQNRYSMMQHVSGALF